MNYASLRSINCRYYYFESEEAAKKVEVVELFTSTGPFSVTYFRFTSAFVWLEAESLGQGSRL